MTSSQTQLEKPQGTSWLVRAGRVSVAVVVVAVIWPTVSGWRQLFAPHAAPARQEPLIADRWDRLSTALAAPGSWRVLGTQWSADFRVKQPAQPVDDSIHARGLPAQMPAATDEERSLVALIDQLGSTTISVDKHITQRQAKFSWGRITAATTGMDGIERLLEVVVNIGDTTGGYLVRVQPLDEQIPINSESLGLAMPKSALRLGTRFDIGEHPVCEVWLSNESIEACTAIWQAQGWRAELSPPNAPLRHSACMLTRSGESICVLLPAAKSSTSRGNLLILVRLADEPMSASAER